MARLYNVTGPYNHRFFGLEMSQNALAPALFNTLLESERPARVIEIGTCKGGLSYLLALGAELLGYEFITVDIRESLVYALPRATVLVGDAFMLPVHETIAAPGKTILLCDGGDKVLEFTTFAPYLKPGDIIGAHDYYVDEQYWAWSEISEDDVVETCAACDLEPYMPQRFGRAAWLMRRRSAPPAGCGDDRYESRPSRIR